MKDQNNTKYQQKELTWRFKLLRKQEIIIFISLPHNLMSNRSRENWICENKLIMDFRGQIETKYNRILIV